ncbi:phage baseplate assembly protein V [Chryseobacterium sp. MYb264]|uniref:type VI secretion system Vgr family protein n=1 Tax=Chryseobacterium sp. MYb264 TaxID=2745153 RepID=UPI002E132E5A|nr:phage baseplate assembly protein V [Chryseobacterium sp. MYb264]
MNKDISNSEKILRNQIIGINRTVKLDIVVNGLLINSFKYFRLNESAKTHHSFELILAHDSLEEVQNHNLEQAQQFLGKRITVVFKYKEVDMESPEMTFVGLVTKVAFSQEKMSLGNIVLKGHSPTILMDSAPHTQSFGGAQPVNTSIIASKIIKETLGNDDFDVRIDTQNKSYINYSTQYCETHYNYLARLAEAYGEQFYYEGDILHFGKLPQTKKAIKLVYGSNVTDIQVELKAVHTKPEYFGYNSSNNSKMLGSDNEIKHVGDLSQKAYKLNESIFKTRSLTPTPINANMFMDVDDSQKSARGSKAVEVFTVSGNTTVPFLYVGCVADIDMRNQSSNQTSHFTTLMMTEVNHEVDGRGFYSGSFEAIAEGTGYMPKPDYEIPKAEPQIATVISNVDPLNQGRIQVRFDWQVNDNTHFIRMMSPDAGGTDVINQNRGFVAVPEIGDQVMVGFEYHNPDFPFAMGGMFHGGIGLGGGMDNRVKSLQTRSGHRLVFTEDESILLTDKSGNELRFDTEGSNINITAPETITIKSKNLKFDIEENIETHVGKNMDTNVGQNIRVIAKQEITQDSGKKTAINAGTNTEISAKAHLDLYGKEKLIGYTDGQTEFGAKERMHVYGANSLLTAKEKIEYKAPQMNKLPQNGDFEYTREKQIASMYWAYEEENASLMDDSKFFVDMNLIVQTRNYEEGESIDVTIKSDDGEPLAEGLTELTLSGVVDRDGIVVFKEPLKPYTLELMKDEEIETI